MSIFADWLASHVVDERNPADPRWVGRAARLTIASLSRLPGEQLQNLFRARLAKLPFIEETVSRDEAVREYLRVPMERVRFLTHDAVVSEDMFVQAAVEALNYRPASLVDRNGRIYEVRAYSVLPKATGRALIFVRDDGHVFIDNNGHVALLTDDLDGLTESIGSSRKSLGLSATEATRLAKELVDFPPRDRLSRIDEAIRKAPSAFYQTVPIRLRAGEGLRPSDLVPIDVSILRPLLQTTTPNWAEDLVDRYEWELAFSCAASLPRALPDAIIESAPDPLKDDYQEFLAWACLRGPIGALHAARLLIAKGADAEPSQIISDAVKLTLATDGADMVAKIKLARWFGNEIGRHEEARSWQPSERIAAAWIHSAILIPSLAAAGYSAARFLAPLENRMAIEEIFLAEPVEVEAPSHPLRVTANDLLICCLADLVELTNVKLSDDTLSIVKNSVWSEKVFGFWSAPLYHADANSSADPLQSFMTGDRAWKLGRIFGERLSTADLQAFGDDFLKDVVMRRLHDDPQMWSYVAGRIIGASFPLQAISASLLDEVRQGRTDSQLRIIDANAWRTRLIALSHNFAVSDAFDAEVFLPWFRASIELVVADPRGNASDAAAILESYSRIVRRLPANERTTSLAALLEFMARGSIDFASSVGHIAQAVRSRFAASNVPREISSAILRARAAGR
jgi:hypothetical protein